jgi:hypothetical protein
MSCRVYITRSYKALVSFQIGNAPSNTKMHGSPVYRGLARLSAMAALRAEATERLPSVSCKRFERNPDFHRADG